jgi:SAM-dependent methyltransferase
VSGIDVEPDVVWFARELGLDVTAADAETDPLQEGPFDAVTLWGMLQLAYRPQRLLERIREVLSPGGVLAIGVSNAGGLGARVFGASWRGLGLPRHLTHFTPGTLRRLAEWAGYEVIRQHFETPRWITAGSVDDVVQLPGPIGSAVRTATHLASQPFAKTSLADTMVMFAVSR